MEDLKVGDCVTHSGVDYVMRVTQIYSRGYSPDPAFWAKCQWDDGARSRAREFKLATLARAESPKE